MDTQPGDQKRDETQIDRGNSLIVYVRRIAAGGPLDAFVQYNFGEYMAPIDWGIASTS